jgi:hypothetical protein
MTNPVRVADAVAATRDGWTPAMLARLRLAGRLFGGDLSLIAPAVGRTRAACDRGLWALVGRDLDQAHAALLAHEASIKGALSWK